MNEVKENLPCVLRSDITVEEMFGELMEFEVWVKTKMISVEDASYALYRQNTGILRYKAEFTHNRWSERSETDEDGDMCKVLKIIKTEKEAAPVETDAEVVEPLAIEYKEHVGFFGKVWQWVKQLLSMG